MIRWKGENYAIPRAGWVQSSQYDLILTELFIKCINKAVGGMRIILKTIEHEIKFVIVFNLSMKSALARCTMYVGYLTYWCDCYCFTQVNDALYCIIFEHYRAGL